MPKSRGSQIVNSLKKKTIKRKNALKKLDLDAKVDYHYAELNKYRKLDPIQEIEETIRSEHFVVTMRTPGTSGNNLSRNMSDKIAGAVSVPLGRHLNSESVKEHDKYEDKQKTSESKVKSESNLRYSKVIVDEVMTEVKKSAKKKNPPELKPEALCFDLKGNDVSHTDVLNEVRNFANLFRDVSVKFVQFLPIEERWVLTMNSTQSRDRLTGAYVTINGREVQLRRYDDIMKLEYRKYLRAGGLIELVNSIP